jgi:hypothetical protein
MINTLNKLFRKFRFVEGVQTKEHTYKPEILNLGFLISKTYSSPSEVMVQLGTVFFVVFLIHFFYHVPTSIFFLFHLNANIWYGFTYTVQ